MNETKTKSIDLVNPVEMSKLNPTIPTPAAPAKAAVKPSTKPAVTQHLPPLSGKESTQVVGPPPPVTTDTKLTLADFDAFLKAAPKEWLPTMMVRIANKCLVEKVFATPGAMAEAIVGASKK